MFSGCPSVCACVRACVRTSGRRILDFWGSIYKISDDNLTIMPRLRSTHDVSLIYETSYEGRKKAFLIRFTCTIARSFEMVFE